MNTHDREVLHSSKYEAWETPGDFFALLCREFPIVVDVGAQKGNALCDRYISPHMDALDSETHWAEPGEWCYCNPPYGRHVDEWIGRAVEEQSRGVNVVMLLPSRTDTAWFHDLVAGNAEIRFLRGRLRFTYLGEAQDPAPFPSLVAIFHGKTDA